MKKKIGTVERVFETIIWNFRFFVLLPVIFSLFSCVKFFAIGTLNIWAGIRLEFDIEEPEGEVAYQIVSYIIGGVDYYLIGIVLLIFSFGVYELFISKIDVKLKNNEIKIFQSESLEALKGKLVQVIVVALIVSLFKKMLSLNVNQAGDLVYLALAIFLITVSSYLLHLQYKDPDKLLTPLERAQNTPAPTDKKAASGDRT